MPIRVEPMTEADLDALLSLMLTTFRSYNNMVYSAPPSAASRAAIIALFRNQLLADPTILWFKAVDPDLPADYDAVAAEAAAADAPVQGELNAGRGGPTGGMVAAARWHVYARERSEAEVDEAARAPELVPEVNAEFVRAHTESVAAVRKEVMGGKPHYLLGQLATFPMHERRGAASLLVRHGCELADKAGLPCFLEASYQGRPLYERHGFETVKEVPFDCTPFGVPGTFMRATMVRNPR